MGLRSVGDLRDDSSGKWGVGSTCSGERRREEEEVRKKILDLDALDIGGLEKKKFRSGEPELTPRAIEVEIDEDAKFSKIEDEQEFPDADPDPEAGLSEERVEGRGYRDGTT